MRPAWPVAGAIFTLLGASPAMADELSGALGRLLANPPSGFVALRGERTSTVWPKWAAKPFIPNASCELQGAETDPQQELRCTVNAQSSVEVASAWYKHAKAEIDATVRKLPHGAHYKRQPERAQQADQSQTTTTLWVCDQGGTKVEIELSNNEEFGFGSNTLSVRYLTRPR